MCVNYDNKTTLISEKEYKLLNDKNFYFDELDSLHEIQKEKFPQDFFPEVLLIILI